MTAHRMEPEPEARVTNITVVGDRDGLEVSLRIKRGTGLSGQTPRVSDIPPDIRTALMKWLVEGLPRDKHGDHRWPDIGLPGSEPRR